MKNILNILIMPLLIILLITYIVINNYKFVSSDDKSLEIINSLLNKKYSISSNSCFPNTTIKTVENFAAAYIHWTLQERGRNDFSQLNCESGKVSKCTWSYGRSSINEAWSSSLTFNYDENKNSILDKSIACLDIP